MVIYPATRTGHIVGSNPSGGGGGLVDPMGGEPATPGIKEILNILHAHILICYMFNCISTTASLHGNMHINVCLYSCMLSSYMVTFMTYSTWGEGGGTSTLGSVPKGGANCKNYLPTQIPWWLKAVNRETRWVLWILFIFTKQMRTGWNEMRVGQE